ncbi:MAG: hypothetical protein ACREBB_11820 [Nitrosotalea sp.]
MSNSTTYFFDKKPINDDDLIYDPEFCPICKEPFSEHSTQQAVDCALAIIEGGKAG